MLPQATYFYSHAREGRDLVAADLVILPVISTHTPARGVTSIGIDGEQWY